MPDWALVPLSRRRLWLVRPARTLGKPLGWMSYRVRSYRIAAHLI